jgi:hypothetical protein
MKAYQSDRARNAKTLDLHVHVFPSLCLESLPFLPSLPPSLSLSPSLPPSSPSHALSLSPAPLLPCALSFILACGDRPHHPPHQKYNLFSLSLSLTHTLFLSHLVSNTGTTPQRRAACNCVSIRKVTEAEGNLSWPMTVLTGCCRLPIVSIPSSLTLDMFTPGSRRFANFNPGILVLGIGSLQQRHSRRF